MEGNGMELTEGGIDMIGGKTCSGKSAGDMEGGLVVLGSLQSALCECPMRFRVPAFCFRTRS